MVHCADRRPITSCGYVGWTICLAPAALRRLTIHTRRMSKASCPSSPKQALCLLRFLSYSPNTTPPRLCSHRKKDSTIRAAYSLTSGYTTKARVTSMKKNTEKSRLQAYANVWGAQDEAETAAVAATARSQALRRQAWTASVAWVATPAFLIPACFSEQGINGLFTFRNQYPVSEERCVEAPNEMLMTRAGLRSSHPRPPPVSPPVHAAESRLRTPPLHASGRDCNILVCGSELLSAPAIARKQSKRAPRGAWRCPGPDHSDGQLSAHRLRRFGSRSRGAFPGHLPHDFGRPLCAVYCGRVCRASSKATGWQVVGILVSTDMNIDTGLGIPGRGNLGR